MKWDMEVEEMEAVLEKIWELHNKLSDAIHSISRAHFLNSTNSLNRSSDDFFAAARNHCTSYKKKNFSDSQVDDSHHRDGFVYVKDFRVQEDGSAIQEIKNLNCIRTALENLEDQLEFFHAVQIQQRAERDAAVARLERSRIVLVMRLAEHQGKKYKVLEEAQAFVGDACDSSHFVSPENLYGSVASPSGEKLVSEEGKKSNALIRRLASSFMFMRRSLKLDHVGGICGNAVGDLLGNAALVVISMLALMRMHKVTSKEKYTSEFIQGHGDGLYNRNVTKVSRGEGSSSSNSSNMDVLLAKG